MKDSYRNFVETHQASQETELRKQVFNEDPETLKEKILELQAIIQKTEVRCAQKTEVRCADSKIEIHGLKAQISQLCNSRSWRFTRPLRFFMFMVHKYKIPNFRNKLRQIGKKLITRHQSTKIHSIYLTSRAQDIFADLIYLANVKKDRGDANSH